MPFFKKNRSNPPLGVHSYVKKLEPGKFVSRFRSRPKVETILVEDPFTHEWDEMEITSEEARSLRSRKLREKKGGR